MKYEFEIAERNSVNPLTQIDRQRSDPSSSPDRDHRINEGSI